MRIYEVLESWEQHLENIEKNKKIGLIVLFLGLIGYVGYSYFIEPLLEEIKSKESEIKKVEKKISHNKTKFLERQIASLKKRILKERADIEDFKSKRYKLMEKLRKQKKIFYTQQNFSQFLDKMLASSVRKDILIDVVGIKSIKEKYLGKLRAVREIEVNGSADFINFIRFLREVEDQKLLLKVDEVMVEQKEDIPAFFYKIKFYGVEN